MWLLSAVLLKLVRQLWAAELGPPRLGMEIRICPKDCILPPHHSLGLPFFTLLHPILVAPPTAHSESLCWSHKAGLICWPLGLGDGTWLPANLTPSRMVKFRDHYSKNQHYPLNHTYKKATLVTLSILWTTTGWGCSSVVEHILCLQNVPASISVIFRMGRDKLPLVSGDNPELNGPVRSKRQPCMFLAEFFALLKPSTHLWLPLACGLAYTQVSS